MEADAATDHMMRTGTGVVMGTVDMEFF